MVGQSQHGWHHGTSRVIGRRSTHPLSETLATIELELRHDVDNVVALNDLHAGAAPLSLDEVRLCTRCRSHVPSDWPRCPSCRHHDAA